MGILGKSLCLGKIRRKEPRDHIDVVSPSGASFSGVVVRVPEKVKVEKRCKNPHHLGDKKCDGWASSWFWWGFLESQLPPGIVENPQGGF